MDGFHMEKAFSEREFQTIDNVCIETVIIVSCVFKYSKSLVFSGTTTEIINCIKSKQTRRKTTVKLLAFCWLFLYSMIIKQNTSAYIK